MKSVTKIGILGGGQLGKMFAQAASRLGFRVTVFCPEEDCPASHAAAEQIVAPYDDRDKLKRFAQSVEVVTYEFENIPVAAFDALEEYVSVYPPKSAQHICQNRLREKSFFRSIGIATVRFVSVTSSEELVEAERTGFFPAVLKTTEEGYDGKGQRSVSSKKELLSQWEDLNQQPSILEEKVSLRSECSVVVARDREGEIRVYGPFDNIHRNHVLFESVFPSSLGDSLCRQAREAATAVAESLSYVGVLCVEFFVTENGQLLANEIAPRPHNSGHLTIEAFSISQFESQLRAIAQLPLGDPRPTAGAAIMTNILGDSFSDGEIRHAALLSSADTYLHLYGKRDPRAGRKMGHFTVIGDTLSAIREKVSLQRKSLGL